MQAAAKILVSIACLGLVAAPAVADESRRTVNVSGSASLTAAPDRASISLGVQARDASLETARAQVAKVAGAFLALCRKLGIPEQKVQTTGLSMRPEYRWDPEGRQQQFAGYFVQRSLLVELDDLDLLGKLIEGAVDAGVNEVSPPQLDSSRRDELHRQALVRAAEDARAKAELLATTLAAKLGPVRQIDATEPASPPQPMMMRAQMAEAGDAAATYQTGEIRFDARVNASFDLQ